MKPIKEHTVQPEQSNRLSAGILKAIGMFGGVQVVQILCSVVRAKLVALWIGPAGVAFFGIFNSALESIYALTQMGIRQSAVRDIAAAPPHKLSSMIRIIRRWCWMLGVTGALLTLVCSGLLSRLSFGTDAMWHSYAWLALIVGLGALSAGEGAVFQGLQHLKKLATCSVIGAMGGLAVSIPMFYFWRIDSIVPSIMAYGIINWIALGLYRERLPHQGCPISVRQTIEAGKKFMMLGIYLTLSGFVSNAVNFLFISYLNNYAGTEDAGLYQAGFTMVNRYVGLVMTAVSMEYFPRLASVATSLRRTSTFVANQIVLLMALLAPIILIFISFTPVVIQLLYSAAFIGAQGFVIWAAMGTVLRGLSWCMSFVIIARGDGVTLLLTELLSGAICLALNIVCFRTWGLTGLGYAFCLWYAVYTAMIAVVYFRNYRLSLPRKMLLFPLYTIVICIAGAIVASVTLPVATLPLAAVSAVVSYRILAKKAGKGRAKVNP